MASIRGFLPRAGCSDPVLSETVLAGDNVLELIIHGL